MATNSSSSANPQASRESKLRRSAFTSTPGKKQTSPSKHEGALGAVLDIFFHIQGFYEVLKEAEPLDMIGTEDERKAFRELKRLLKQMADGAPEDSIDLTLFLRMMSKYTAVQFEGDVVDIMGVWDTVVRLIVVVIPPLREIFLGHITHSRERMESPGWLNIMSRSFRARYSTTCNNLDDACQSCYTSVSEKHLHGTKNSVQKSTQTANAMVLRRAPSFFVASVESSHFDELLEKFERAKNQVPNSNSKGSASTKSGSGGDDAKKKANEGDGGGGSSPHGDVAPASIEIQRALNLNDYAGKEAEDTREYELSTVLALQGESFEDLKVFLNTGSATSPWHSMNVHKGKASLLEPSSVEEATSAGLYNVPPAVNGISGASNSHPRILIYTRTNLAADIKRTCALVTQAGQMKALGDVAFALTQTISNYEEAKQYYEEAIRLDESYREPLRENLATLEIFDRTMRARNLEEQADLALANRRFKEASENYQSSVKTSLEGSRIYHRVKEKMACVTTVLDLEVSQQLVGQGEIALKNSQYSRAQELYSRAQRVNPELIHLKCILQGIEITIQTRAAASKVADAYAAMKTFRYKEANVLFQQAVALDASVEESIREVSSTLGPLMQEEDALNKQKEGLHHLDEKRLDEAAASFSEGITLLPPNAFKEHASLLADRSQVHLVRQQWQDAISDCFEALGMNPDLAIAHFRIGAAYFGLESFDDAVGSYEKAVRYDPSLADLVKSKIRQVNSAREVLQRKIREEERAREKAAQEALLKEKREKEEKARKERAEKAAAEKAERNRLKEIERQEKLAKQKEEAALAASQKEAEATRKKLEKAQEKERKARERELAKVEKEKEKERMRREKERQAEQAAAARQEEMLRQQEQQQERERLRVAKEEKERSAEAAKEKARQDRERIIEERRVAREAKEKGKDKDKEKDKDKDREMSKDVPGDAAGTRADASALASGAVGAGTNTTTTRRPSGTGAGPGPLSALAIGQKQATQSTQSGSQSQAGSSPGATNASSTPSSSTGAGAGAGAGASASGWGRGASSFASAAVSNEDFPALGGPPASASASASTSTLATSGHGGASASGAFRDSFSGLSALNASPALGGLSGGSSGGGGGGGGGMDGVSSELNASTPSFVYNPQKPLMSRPPKPPTVELGVGGGLDLGSSLGAALDARPSSAVDPHRAFATGLGTGGLGLFSAGSTHTASPNPHTLDPRAHAHGHGHGHGEGGGGGASAEVGTSEAFGLGGGPSFGRLGGVDIGGALGTLGSGVGIGAGAGAGAGAGTDIGGHSMSPSPRGDPLLEGIGGLSMATDPLGSSLLSSLGAFDDDAFPGSDGDLDSLSSDILGSGGSNNRGLLGGLHGTSTTQLSASSHTHAHTPLHSHAQQHPLGLAGTGTGTGGSGAAPVSSLSMMMSANKIGLGDFEDHSSFLQGGSGSGNAESSQHHRHQHQLQQQQHQQQQQHHQQQQQHHNQPGPGLGGGGGTAGGDGIDKDMVRPERCQEMFPSIAWLDSFGLSLYHWSGDQKEWTAYALYLPQEFLSVFLFNDGARLKEFRERSGCSMWIDKERLRGKVESFLVFHRGASGQPSNMAMNTALDLVSALLRQVISQKQQQQMF
jgi:hypothetical protein